MPDLLLLNPGDLAVQSTIRLPLPLVVGNCDYAERESQLLRMDALLQESGAEASFIAMWVQRVVAEDGKSSGAAPRAMTDRRRATVQGQAVTALRCTVARVLSDESHRSFSAHLAESALLQWFCRVERMDGIVRVPSKSTLQRMESEVPAEVIQDIQRSMLRWAATPAADGQAPGGLADLVDLSVTWMDTTCAKLDIHYPTDWVLLRDATRLSLIHI
jgi:hypothetical protein